MTPLQCLLCNQYDEITKKGKDGKSALANTIMLSTALAVLYFFILLYLINLATNDSLTSGLDSSAMSGKAMGRIFALVAGVIVFMILKYGVATESWYTATTQQYNSMSEPEKQAISKKGIKAFLILFIPALLFLIIMVVL